MYHKKECSVITRSNKWVGNSTSGWLWVDFRSIYWIDQQPQNNPLVIILTIDWKNDTQLLKIHCHGDREVHTHLIVTLLMIISIQRRIQVQWISINYSWRSITQKNTWLVMKYATFLSEMTYLKLVKFGTSWLCYRLNNEKRLKKSKSIACFSFSFLICNFSW